MCICIDDFGLHAGIDQAALHLVGMARVHAVGCLVGGGSWKSGHAALRQIDPVRLDVGLHLDFTEAPQVLRSPRRLSRLIVASYLRQLDAREVRSEIRAQLDAFEQSMGRAPAFVDGHQHVHQLPVIRQELLHELQDRYPGRRPWLRSTHAPHSGFGNKALKPRIIESLGSKRLLLLARQACFSHNGQLLGVYDFQGGEARYLALMAGWLRSAAGASLLMTHPSLPLQRSDPLLAARTSEFTVLSGKPIASLLLDAGMDLRPMSMILSDSPGVGRA